MTKEYPAVVLHKQSGGGGLFGCKKWQVLKKGINIESIKSAKRTCLPGVYPLNENKNEDIRSIMEFIDEVNREGFKNIVSA